MFYQSYQSGIEMAKGIPGEVKGKPINRTKVELKYVDFFKKTIKIRKLSIVPKWN